MAVEGYPEVKELAEQILVGSCTRIKISEELSERVLHERPAGGSGSSAPVAASSVTSCWQIIYAELYFTDAGTVSR